MSETVQPKQTPPSLLQTARRERQYALLHDHPEVRAERVARHYLAQVSMAHRILKCVELRSYGPSRELDELLDHYLQIISENHRTDLGIDLEWDYPHTVDFYGKP